MNKKSKKGFTLTELIVVIVIIGILAAVVTPMVIKYIDTAKLSNDKALVKQLNDRLQIDKLDHDIVYTNSTQIDGFLNRNEIANDMLILKTAGDGNDVWFNYTTQKFFVGKNGQDIEENTNGTDAGSSNMLLNGENIITSNIIEDLLASGKSLVSIKGSNLANAVNDYRNGIENNDLENYFDDAGDKNIYQNDKGEIFSNNPSVLAQNIANGLTFKRRIGEIDYTTFMDNYFTIEDLILPSSITLIKAFTFIDSKALNITIPSEINVFEQGAFFDCMSSVNGSPIEIDERGNLTNINITLKESSLEVDENIKIRADVLELIEGNLPSFNAGDEIEFNCTLESGVLVDRSKLVFSVSSNYVQISTTSNLMNILHMGVDTEEVTIKIRHIDNMTNPYTRSFKISLKNFQDINLKAKEEQYNGNFQLQELYPDFDFEPLEYVGVLPAGTEVKYKLKEVTGGKDAGQYHVVATIRCQYYKEKVVENVMTIVPRVLKESDFNANIANYTYPSMAYTAKNITSLEFADLLDEFPPVVEHYRNKDGDYLPIEQYEVKNVGIYKIIFNISLGPNYTDITLECVYEILKGDYADIDPSAVHTFELISQPYFEESLSSYTDYIRFVINDTLLADDDLFYESHIIDETKIVSITGPGVYNIYYEVQTKNYYYKDTYVLMILPKEKLSSGYGNFTYAVGTNGDIWFKEIYLDALKTTLLETYKVYDSEGNLLGDSIYGVSFASFNYTNITEIMIEIEACELIDESLQRSKKYERISMLLYLVPGAINIIDETTLQKTTTANTVLWSNVKLENINPSAAQERHAFNMSHDLYGNGFKLEYVENTIIYLGNSSSAFNVSANKLLQNVELNLNKNIQYIANTASKNVMKHVMLQGVGSTILDSIIHLDIRGIQQWVPNATSDVHVFTIKNTTLIGGPKSYSLVYMNDNSLASKSKYCSFIFDNVTLLKGQSDGTIGFLNDGPKGGGKVYLSNVKSYLWYTENEINNAISNATGLSNTAALKKAAANYIASYGINLENGSKQANSIALIYTKNVAYFSIAPDNNNGLDMDCSVFTYILSLGGTIVSYKQERAIYDQTFDSSSHQHIFGYSNLG